jgi:putative endonuclease
MANKSRMLYTGVTNNIVRRAAEHKNNIKPGFTKRFNLIKLVYFETTDDVFAAISREKQIKGWVRRKKTALINSVNPGWEDLSLEWIPPDPYTLRLAQGDM